MKKTRLKKNKKKSPKKTMEEVEKSTQLKKCASLNNLIQNNQSSQMSTTQSQNSPAQR